jgi:transcriptional regulator with XRE-family HTH domain
MANVEPGTHTLARLIDAVADARGLSDEDIARRARSRGHQLSKSNISRIRNEPVKTINASVMRALADGLGLPVTAVLQAALKAMGLPAGEVSNSFEDVVKGDPSLIPEARDHLLKQYRLLLRVDQAAA